MGNAAALAGPPIVERPRMALPADTTAGALPRLHRLCAGAADLVGEGVAEGDLSGEIVVLGDDGLGDAEHAGGKPGMLGRAEAPRWC